MKQGNSVAMILTGALLGVSSSLAVYVPLITQLAGAEYIFNPSFIIVICIGIVFGVRWGLINTGKSFSALFATLPYTIAIVGWIAFMTATPNLSNTAIAISFIALVFSPVLIKSLMDKARA